jgi:hypothetical protein
MELILYLDLLVKRMKFDEQNIYNNLTATNCLVTIGELQCVYQPTDTNNFVLPFTLSGSRDCVWSNPMGPVVCGTKGGEIVIEIEYEPRGSQNRAREKREKEREDRDN